MKEMKTPVEKKIYRLTIPCDQILVDIIEKHRNKRGLTWDEAVKDLCIMGDYFVEHSTIETYGDFEVETDEKEQIDETNGGM